MAAANGRRGSLRVLLLAGALLIPVSAPAQDAGAAPATDDGATDLDSLRQQMEDLYLQVERDFKSLAGKKSADRLKELAASARTASQNADKDADAWAAAATAWVEGKLLGSIVAKRLADSARAATDGEMDTEALTDVLGAAVAAVFPEKTMDGNWDKAFQDLPIVSKWRAASGLEPLPDSGKGTGDTAGGKAVVLDPSDMVLVPRGKLAIPEGRGRGWPVLGQKAEKRTVRAFYIDRTEVTCAAYADFLGKVKRKKDRERWTPKGWKVGEDGVPLVPEGRALFPVTGITYDGAAAFADHHDKRLPREDEWERAARGDEGRLYPWGDAWKDGAAVAGGVEGPKAVGTAADDVSPYGAMDMAGNVSEVCATYVDGKPVKGKVKDTDQLVRRGGNFQDSVEDATNDYRYATGPSSMARTDRVGFRCVMDERAYKRRFKK
ncbi:MAG: formylglycine-generating enzyme family protein [Planctomycetota bacterium]